MRRIGKIVIALLLCLTMSTAAAESAMNLPAQLVEIKSEAFYGDTALRQVTIPQSVRTIGERAFAYSAVREIVLPPTLTDVAANAFEGCEEIAAVVYAGSYAHVYCEENGIPYTFDPNDQAYAITALETRGREFLAAATTQAACVLQVEVLTEDQTPFFTR